MGMSELSATIPLSQGRAGSWPNGGYSLGLDETLVLETQRGDHSAFSGIYEQYFNRVYRYALVRIGNAAEAEDLAADVFLKAFEKLNTFKAKRVPFAAWLFRIAHNLVVDHLRRRSRRPTTELHEGLPLLDDAPDDLVVLGLTMDDVRSAMEEVTDAQRQVISLRFSGGLSIAETAQAMKKKEGAIKALQHSAINALRRQLARRGHEIDVS